jgi:hypothetical protein
MSEQPRLNASAGLRLRADREMRGLNGGWTYSGEAAAYQVWNEPKCGCWATIASGRGA